MKKLIAIFFITIQSIAMADTSLPITGKSAAALKKLISCKQDCEVVTACNGEQELKISCDKKQCLVSITGDNAFYAEGELANEIREDLFPGHKTVNFESDVDEVSISAAEDYLSVHIRTE